MRNRLLLPITLAGAVALAGCGAAGTTGTTGSTATTGSTSTTQAATTTSDATTATSGATGTLDVAASLASTHERASDLTWDETSETAITLVDGASTVGPGATVEGDTVTVTAAGTYRLTGTLTAGQIVVDSAGDGVVRLVLDGVDVTSPSGPALLVADADEVVIVLADGSTNHFADTAAAAVSSDPEVDTPNAAVYSTSDLTIGGTGTLVIDGSVEDALTGKDGLVILGGTIAVSAVDDGIRGKDYLVIRDGAITVTAGGDGLRSDNADDTSVGYVLLEGGSVSIEAGSDGIDTAVTAAVSGGTLEIAAGDDGIHSESALEISGGTVTISRSYEGLEGTQILISGGFISVVADDDGLNVAGDGATGTADAGPGGRGGMNEKAVEGWFASVTGGTLLIDAGGDGFDSNGDASITGGIVVISGPETNGNGAIDVNGGLEVSEATLLAVGSAGMAQAPTTSGQGTIDAVFNATQPAGTVVQVRAADSTVIATFESTKAFQSVVLTSPSIVAGTTYEIYVGGSVSGDSLGILYPDADAAGTLLGSVSAT